MPKKLHNIYLIAIFLLGVLPCVVLAIFWVLAVISWAGTFISALTVVLYDGDFFMIVIGFLWIFMSSLGFICLGFIGTMTIWDIFKHVKNDRKIPLKKVYQGLATVPLVIIVAFSFHFWGILLLLPVLSLFVAMLYNRSWAKHQGVVSDAH